MLEKYTINSIDKEIESKIKLNWDTMAKPLDSMGKFETIIGKIGAILGLDRPDIKKRALVIMCADNGVVEEHISQSGQEVTAIVAKDMGIGRSNVCHMCKQLGVDTFPVDIGINTTEKFDGVIDKKIAFGTKNFAKYQAMSIDEATKAIVCGIEIVEELKNKGYKIIATGEMGIGNTTTSSAIATALLKVKSSEIVGRGAGLSDDGLERKKKVVQSAVDKYGLYDKSAMEVLASVGGLDIAGLVGVFIGGAVYNVPIVIDGAISLVAAFTAQQIKPGCRDYMIASHQSREPYCQRIMQLLDLQPCITADMALGEGTGAVMMIGLLDTVMALYDNNRSFEDISMEPYQRFV